MKAMNKDLKKYFEENRPAFDVEKPPKNLWDNIDARLEADKPSGKVRSLLSYWKAAAILLLAFGLGFLVAQNRMSQNMGQSSLSNYAPEAAEATQFYFTNIQTFTEELKSYQKTHPQLVQTFLKEHEQLDTIYDELKNDLTENIDNEKILALMIQNLQLRLKVLEKQKSIIENIVKQKNQKNANTYL